MHLRNGTDIFVSQASARANAVAKPESSALAPVTL
jgi:hypothetical protein